MPRFDFAEAQARAIEFAQVAFAPDQVAITVTAILLVIAFSLSIAAIWRGRRRVEVPSVTPSPASGFTRWLTPMGMASIPAAQGVAARPARKSGSMKAIKVNTPVSKVSAKALKHAAGDALEIARRTGLSRDAVAMMMAKADPKAAAARSAPPRMVAPMQEPTRSVSNGRAMVEPSPYAAAAAAKVAPKAKGLGTRFNARLG